LLLRVLLLILLIPVEAFLRGPWLLLIDFNVINFNVLDFKRML
jgi:hypothetical protein